MAIKSLLDLVDELGFDVIDSEIDAWIAMGEFDEAVVKRVTDLGWIPPDSKYSDLDQPLFHY